MSAPPLRRRTAEVVANRQLGAYRQLSVVVPALPARARPGQFVLTPSREADRVLSQAWWVAGERTEDGFGSTLDLVVPQDAALPPAGEALPLTGPIGRGFGVPTTPVPAVVATEGAAGAAARWLCERLRAAGCGAHLLSVAPDPEHHVDLVRARRSTDGVVLVEPEGVAEALAALTRRTGAAVLYAVGQLSLSATVAAVAAAEGVVSQVSGLDLTEEALCGHGLCGACDLPLAGRREAWVRPCAHGPVIRGDLVAWGSS